MNIEEKTLYHQIHPLKLGTDFGSAFLFIYYLWKHEVLLALVTGFVPPVLITFVMLKWFDLRWLQRSAFGNYIRHYMTRLIEIIRLLTLVPMTYGAWIHEPYYIVLGFVILI